MTHLNVQEVTIGPFLAGIKWKYIQHDPWCSSDKITTHPDVQEATVRPIFGEITSIMHIRLHHDPSGRTRGDYSFLFFRDGRTRGDNFAFFDILFVYFILYLQKYVAHKGVPQGLPMCYLLTRW